MSRWPCSRSWTEGALCFRYGAVCSCELRLFAYSYGPIFVGMVFNVLLYGIMITQTYLYFHVYRR